MIVIEGNMRTRMKAKQDIEIKKLEEKKGKSKIFFYIIPIVLLCIIALGAAGYFYLQYNNVLNKFDGKDSAKELTLLIKKVGTLIVLPTGETPRLATVSDAAKLKEQEFFSKAENGDKVLIYTNAKKAYLYRPSTNRIIEVGPVNLSSQNSESPTGSIAPTKPVAIVLYNGTAVEGLTKTVEKDLIAKNIPVTIAGRGNAKSNYEKTLIIDLTGKNEAFMKQLATILNADTTTSLPEGEVKPTSGDILVILGIKK